jgi:hypothetical protein
MRGKAAEILVLIDIRRAGVAQDGAIHCFLKSFPVPYAGICGWRPA